jgi:hypothetical protein
MRTHWAIAAAIGLLLAAPAAAAEEEGVALTVYNGGYGVVREVRSLEIDEGTVKFADVARHIDATTVHFKSLTDPAAKLLEQNYQYDLVSADKLLKKYIDKPIEVICEGGRYAGTLLSFDARQLVLRADAGGITMVRRPDNVRDIRFKVLPEGLLTRPTLLWQVATRKPGKHRVEVTYQTGGMGWHAEYVMVLDRADTAADLSGWVSVQNNSGKTYRDAGMKFIAGDVRRVQPRPTEARALGRARKRAAAPAMEEKAFFEYHMYTLQRPSTVADNEVKQLEMFAPVRGIKVAKRFLYNPLRGFRWRGGYQTNRGYGTGRRGKVQVFVEFRNAKANKLGIPLPAGKVRVYKLDPDDKAMEFVGEEQIDHTPADEKLSLLVGNAFDLVGERKQTRFESNTRAHWIKESVRIKLRNHKKEDVVIRVKEPMYRARQWKITQTSHERNEAAGDAHTAVWDLPVKADGETVLTYSVEYTW